MPLGSCSNPEGMVGARLYIHGRVSDGVLIPNVAGDALTNLHCFAEFGGEEGFTAGLKGKTTKHLRVPVRITLIEDANRLDHGA